MKCKRCGTELRNDDEFCYHCGERTTVLQRLFASRAIVGSSIAIVIVIIAAILTWMIMSGRLDLSAVKTKMQNMQTKKETHVVENDGNDGHGSSGKGEDSPATEAAVAATGTPEASPSPAPSVSWPADVTETEKTEMKGLTERVKPFLAFSASYYENGSHPFKWDDVSATTMALYNLYYLDKTVKYGTPYASVEKKVKKEMKHIFGGNAKFNLTYSGYYPDYVFVKQNGTVLYNVVRTDGKAYKMKVEKIINTKEDKYRVIVSAWLQRESNKENGYAQKYTIYVDRDETAKYGYVVRKIKLYEKKDKKVSG